MRYRASTILTAEDVGQRVTVRRRLDDGAATDVIGELISVEGDHVVVLNKHGDEISIEKPLIVAARVIRR